MSDTQHAETSQTFERRDIQAWLRDPVQAWMLNILEPLQRELAGPPEVLLLRPWSVVVRFPTDRGTLYFKAGDRSSRHEAGLIQRLATRHADCLPQLLGVDVERGWLLMEDAGPRLREQIDGSNWLGHWSRVLKRYAALQLDMAQQAEELQALGVPDRRPATLVPQLAAILDQPQWVRIGEQEGLTPAQHAALVELLPVLKQRCDELSRAGIPGSINHGDFHDGNVFVGPTGYVFIDWGDASVAHPFFSLRTVFVSLENTLGIAENAPAFDPLRDGYLRAFESCCDRASLMAAFELARRLWALGSLLSWHASLSSWPAEQLGEYHHVIPSLLTELLEANQG